MEQNKDVKKKILAMSMIQNQANDEEILKQTGLTQEQLQDLKYQLGKLYGNETLVSNNYPKPIINTNSKHKIKTIGNLSHLYATYTKSLVEGKKYHITLEDLKKVWRKNASVNEAIMYIDICISIGEYNEAKNRIYEYRNREGITKEQKAKLKGLLFELEGKLLEQKQKENDYR